MIRKKKSLGQHFLRDDAIAYDIADFLEALNDDLPILEIGPGEGKLTEALVKKYKERLSLMEIDSRLIPILKNKFPQIADNIHDLSYLDANIPQFFPDGFHLIGNFPYQISSPILFSCIENRTLVKSMVGMFQKEVAKRIVASPGNKQYGVITVLAQIYFDTEYMLELAPQEFEPPPKVHSAVIRLTRKKQEKDPVIYSDFAKLVKTAFGQRRKKLSNSLSAYAQFFDILPQNWLDGRAEELSPDDFIRMFWLIKNKENDKT